VGPSTFLFKKRLREREIGVRVLRILKMVKRGFGRPIFGVFGRRVGKTGGASLPGGRFRGSDWVADA